MTDIRATRDALASATAPQQQGEPMAWTKISDHFPAPHRRYLVRRNETLFTSIPCYGTHKPWWVVTIMGAKREAEPEEMLPTDEWMPAAAPPLDDAVRLLREILNASEAGAHLPATDIRRRIREFLARKEPKK